MKGAAEKAHDAAALEATRLRERIETLHALHAGLPRAVREYPAVASVDWEDLNDGRVLVIRMLYPYEMLRIRLPTDMVTELINRAQGLTAGGAQIATPEQARAILGDRQ